MDQNQDHPKTGRILTVFIEKCTRRKEKFSVGQNVKMFAYYKPIKCLTGR